MDKRQESKFWALFWTYEGQSADIDPLVRSRVLRTLPEPGTRLRADAAYFLLVNFDHMVGRVMAEPFVPKDTYNSPDVNHVLRPIDQALDAILGKLSDSPSQDLDGYSGHQLLRSIDEVWDDLAFFLAWA